VNLCFRKVGNHALKVGHELDTGKMAVLQHDPVTSDDTGLYEILGLLSLTLSKRYTPHAFSKVLLFSEG
jgi:hypothetical protein